MAVNLAALCRCHRPRIVADEPLTLPATTVALVNDREQVGVTAAAATVLHLNFALPMAMESMVTPTGRSEPVMA